MFYTVDEILNNTSGYIFYKSPNFDPSVNYYISGIENYMQLYENTIFIPIKCSINYVLTDSFVMIENYRTGLIWKLFMSHPDIQNGLRRLGFTSPYLK